MFDSETKEVRVVRNVRARLMILSVSLATAAGLLSYLGPVMKMTGFHDGDI